MGMGVWELQLQLGKDNAELAYRVKNQRTSHNNLPIAKAGMRESDLQSLYAGDDGVECSLDVGGGAGADHW